MSNGYPRPIPVVGDTSSAAQRRADPAGWAMGAEVVEALSAAVGARRDIRRYRPDPVPEDVLRAVLMAGHQGPSVGHSQPWRFIVVRSQQTRDRAAHLADRARLKQAAGMTPDRAARLLDLKLDGLREAPVGVVVACDRRAAASGVLGRATFPDADLWSCACAIQNMWLTARAHGLGMGWVTLFEPAELAELLGLPEGVVTLGWLCLGWPDERPPEPGLERMAWSRRMPLEDVVFEESWPAEAVAPPESHLRGPSQDRVVAATDQADELLTTPEALGVLDRAVSRVLALRAPVGSGTLVLACADHPVAGHGVSAYPLSVTRDVTTAAVAGESMGAVAAAQAGLEVRVVDAGVAGGPVPGAVPARPVDPQGDLVTTDPLTPADVTRLLGLGRGIGRDCGARGLVALGEVGIGNTTPATTLACALTGLPVDDAVGLGSGSDSAILDRKHEVVSAALGRHPGRAGYDPKRLLAAFGGPEIAVLTGVVLGAAEAGAPVVLDGLCGSVPALLATRLEPAVQAHLIAGQVSRERAHATVLEELGLEPLLSLRLRAGEGVGACLGASLTLQGVQIRRAAARTRPWAINSD